MTYHGIAWHMIRQMQPKCLHCLGLHVDVVCLANVFGNTVRDGAWIACLSQRGRLPLNFVSWLGHCNLLMTGNNPVTMTQLLDVSKELAIPRSITIGNYYSITILADLNLFSTTLCFQACTLLLSPRSPFATKIPMTQWTLGNRTTWPTIPLYQFLPHKHRALQTNSDETCVRSRWWPLTL